MRIWRSPNDTLYDLDHIAALRRGTCWDAPPSFTTEALIGGHWVSVHDHLHDEAERDGFYNDLMWQWTGGQP